MLTPWAQNITPQNAWRHYPRPALTRENWTCLNGLWNYVIIPKGEETHPEPHGKILVPYAIESSLSGVAKRLKPSDTLQYTRTFPAPDAKTGERTLLHFEAVDYRCEAFINEISVGIHVGGNLPFSFDITEALIPGQNTLRVTVTDQTDSEGAFQLHGKQMLDPKNIWYTPVTGIWQTVWLEQVPANYIADAKITPSISGSVSIKLTLIGPDQHLEATVSASLDGKEIARASGPATGIQLSIPNPQLWSPASPTLYDLVITCGEDRVESYTGLRETTVTADRDGHLRFALNGQTLFHWGTLDQGWWPDGLLTPPSDEAMLSDICFLKEAGFNTIRKHIKVEPRRYYTHCDRIGMLVWQDQVSNATGRNNRIESESNPPWTRLNPNPTDGIWPEHARKQFMSELKGMIDALHNHPSIVQWVTFNEAWGQHDTLSIGNWTANYDPTRQVNIASGGNFFPAGRIVDAHSYPDPEFPFDSNDDGRFDGFVKVMGECGGHGYPVKGHLWNPDAKNWGYGGLPKDQAEWLERYQTSIEKIAALKAKGIAAGIYTQTTDVEGEINGLITYDRKVQKLDTETLSNIHSAANLTP